MTIFAYFPRTRIEHIIRAGNITLCGKDATLAARFAASARGQDARVRPLCPACMTHMPTPH